MHYTERTICSMRIAMCALLCAALLLTACDTVVPDLSGLTAQEAESELAAAGFTLGVIAYDPSSAEATWTVIAWEPSGNAARGDSIHLTLAGPVPALVPDVEGLASSEASAALADALLGPVRVATRYSETVEEGVVISQVPAPDTVVGEGALVRMVVSLGPPPPPSSSLRLTEVDRISGSFSPKSVVASQHGYVFAQNMMYRHTVSVFDEETRELVKTIPDQVVLADFGYSEYSAAVRGGPVEAAVTPDGRHVYVSNYSMYGPGFSRPGDDEGGPSSGFDPSFVYRIPLASLEIDQAIQVGSVPKYVAVTPDGRFVLVTNWISYTLSIIDADAGREIEQVYLGRYPRGIVVNADSTVAYVAVMGSRDIAKVDLDSFEVSWIRGVGATPRHLVLDPEGLYLYVTLNLEGTIAKIDLSSEEVVARVRTGSQPRSMAIAEDGLSLYVVNYESDTVSKVLTETMEEVQELSVTHHPIGVTYVNATREVWVCCYPGVFHVFRDE